MKILTGKAKEGFLKYFKKKIKSKLHELSKIEFVFDLQDELYQNALIVDWFDSVGIKICEFLVKKLWASKVFVEENDFISLGYINRECAKEDGIKKANEIYNQNNK